MHTLNLPFDFSVTTRIDTQSVGSSSLFITLTLSRRVSSSFSLSFRVKAHDEEAWLRAEHSYQLQRRIHWLAKCFPFGRWLVAFAVPLRIRGEGCSLHQWLRMQRDTFSCSLGEISEATHCMRLLNRLASSLTHLLSTCGRKFYSWTLTYSPCSQCDRKRQTGSLPLKNKQAVWCHRAGALSCD